MSTEREIGFVEHWFSKVMVAGIKITNGPLKVGDTIHIKGHTSDFTMTVQSMQIDNRDVEEVETGADIGIRVKDHVSSRTKCTN